MAARARGAAAPCASADERGLSGVDVVQIDVGNTVPVARHQVRRLRHERHQPAVSAHGWMKARAVGIVCPRCMADASNEAAVEIPEVDVTHTFGLPTRSSPVGHAIQWGGGHEHHVSTVAAQAWGEARPDDGCPPFASTLTRAIVFGTTSNA